VHEAEVIAARRDTRKVAVKVIRPGVRRSSIAISKAISSPRACRKNTSREPPLRPVEVTQTLAQTTKIEMDLRLEAAALSELGENTRDDPGFRVPAVDWERTGRDVLTMEWIDGIKMNDVEALRAAGHDLDGIAAKPDPVLPAAHAARRLLPRRHASGNLFVEADGTIVAVDLGITGRLGKKERRFLAEILYGFITRDYLRVAEVHFEAGYVPRDAQRRLLRAGDPRHRRADPRPAGRDDLHGALLTLLFEVTELFDMATRPELVMLQKTMVVVEGVARTLNPPSTCGRRPSRWWRLDPRAISGRAACWTMRGTGVNALVSLARQAPDLAARTERLSREIDAMAEHGLRFDEADGPAIGKAEARYTRSGRVALWVIAAAAGLYCLGFPYRLNCSISL
jgi:ubiquinone biosynthesis protein